MKVSGIYKVVNPKGRVYIGQSIDVEKRFYDYKILNNVSEQPKLYNSLKHYGARKHIFSLIQECEVDLLDSLERYWQEYYMCVEYGLNCVYAPINGKHYFISNDTRIKKSLSMKEYWSKNDHPFLGIKGNNHHNWGMTHGDDAKLKISNSRKEFYTGENHPMFGKKHSQKSKEKMSKSKQGMFLYGNNPKAKIVLDTLNGIYYNSAKEAAEVMGIPPKLLQSWLRGDYTNKTNLIYV